MSKLIELTCKVCGFKALDLVPHIESEHIKVAAPPDDDAARKRATLRWYMHEYGITEDQVIGELIHPSLIEEEEKPMSTKPAKEAIISSGSSVEICGVKMPIRSGGIGYIPSINPAYHFSAMVTDVCRDILENRRILLTGHTGCGKSSLIEQIAAHTKNPVYRLNLNGQTTIGDFVGMWTVKGGETIWIDGALPKAMREGGWLIIDEVSFGEAAILSVLQSVLEPNGKLMLKEKGHELVEPHADFRIFATDNAAGCMADFRGLYQGTNILNEAFLDRWRVYHMGYLPPAEEMKVLAASVKPVSDDRGEHKMSEKIAAQLVKVANMVREAFVKEEISCTFSLRRLIDWGDMMMRHRDPIKGAESTIFSKVSPQDSEVIKELIKVNLMGNRGRGKS